MPLLFRLQCLRRKQLQASNSTVLELRWLQMRFIRVRSFSSVQSLSRVRLSATPWIAARQASLSITNSRSKDDIGSRKKRWLKKRPRSHIQEWELVHYESNSCLKKVRNGISREKWNWWIIWYFENLENNIGFWQNWWIWKTLINYIEY